MSALSYKRTLHNVDEVDRLAASLAPLLREGDVFALNGMLGAGKTRFVQAVAGALAIEGEVTSPTYTIHAAYEIPDSSLVLNHFDLYRLETEDQLDDIGYWEILEGDGMSFVEWADKFPHALPCDFVEMEFVIGEDEVRTITARAYGQRAHRLLTLWASDPAAYWTQ